jgi:hypothetical protein
MRDDQRLLIGTPDPALPATRSMGDGAPDRPDLWATWSCWWGSPQLVAHVARKAESAIADAGPRRRAHCTITLRVGNDCERFQSTDSFLSGATPEALHRFSLLELRVRGNGIKLCARFERQRRSRLGGGPGQAVHLEVTATNRERGRDACRVGRAVAVSLARGYSRYWATSASSPLLREQVGRPLPCHEVITMAATLIVGALLGAGLARVLDHLPGTDLPSQAAIGILVLAGMGYPVLVTQLVPSVEVAPGGRTRLVSVARRTAVTLATFAATNILQLMLV